MLNGAVKVLNGAVLDGAVKDAVWRYESAAWRCEGAEWCCAGGAVKDAVWRCERC